MSSFAQIILPSTSQTGNNDSQPLLFDPDILGSVVASQQAFHNRNELGPAMGLYQHPCAKGAVQI
jgi:hypothetical protein